MIRRIAISLMLAASAMSARAQSESAPLPLVAHEARIASTLLPVVNRETGAFEAFLLVEPSASMAGLPGVIAPVIPSLPANTLLQHGREINRGASTLHVGSALRLEQGGNMALLCDGPANVLTSLGGLASHCLLGALDERADPLAPYTPHLRAQVFVRQGPLRVDLGAGLQRQALSMPPTLYRDSERADDGLWWDRPLLRGYLSDLRLDQLDLSGQARLSLGEQGWLTIGGSLARARLIANTNTLFNGRDWTRTALSVGGGYGAFSGSLIGHSLQSESGATWQGLDFGLSWQTPWNARLSIGAENILSNGDNSVGIGEAGLPEAPKGRTPYVRYQQDL